ncbi:3-hydroxy-3-isohexenylglutaryl-CoA/hydroxy-methylglutaryl-CoA lyase [Luteimonas sp. 9C]|uniref:hydroxymethylglutaryl-CoA lyase n=1 Tax=Luteimonas sp. 9C TaxID=2653148 RepID=UPI0012F41042|nr:hydroxymethylglutaryl-CoA lyase [Luteimonas sp. 9C]VXB25975.1 3-hydroxy-3-isohexenylglutaryl-CoA/hydroxy-methylglutaryl-CoA lyase [Luteimonas sp. 9C]
MSDFVRVVEVGPRDGLQNEKALVPAGTKIALIDRLSVCGFQVVEATSFVSPKWVPQLADAEDVLAGIQRRDNVAYPVLVPNAKGLERALAAGVRHIAVFTAASDAFNLKNTNIDVDGSLERLTPVVEQARAAGVSVRGYVSTVLGCPYQGHVPLADVVRVAGALHAMGCEEISLGDTIGVGTPAKAREMLLACAQAVPMAQLAVHFHDTYGQALANVLACLDAGVRVVDSAVGGLGGCPYAKGASGNLATEDLLYMLEGLGLRTGIDLPAVTDTAVWISGELGRKPASKLATVALANAAA